MAVFFCVLAVVLLRSARNPMEHRVKCITSGTTCAILSILLFGVFVYDARRQAKAVRQLGSTIAPYPGARFISRQNLHGMEVWIWESNVEAKRVLAFYSEIARNHGMKIEESGEGELVIHAARKRVRILSLMSGNTCRLMYRLNSE